MHVASVESKGKDCVFFNIQHTLREEKDLISVLAFHFGYS